MSGEVGQETCHERRASNTWSMARGEPSAHALRPKHATSGVPFFAALGPGACSGKIIFFIRLRITATRRDFSVNGLFVPVVENDGSLLGCIEESYRAQRALRRNSTVTITCDREAFLPTATMTWKFLED